MKKRGIQQLIRPGGILRWSTVCILAGGLAGCDRGSHVVTSKDAEMAATELQLSKLDAAKARLLAGEVEHNFHLEKVGYYHADAHAFFEHPYGYERDGKFFINGEWKTEMLPALASSSRPSAEALKKVEAALEQEQQTASGGHSHGGFGMGNALMMYWLLSGNRGFFSPGAGFRHADGQATGWQRGVDQKRDEVRGYAAANPGYRRMVDQSRATGTPIRPGQTIRGGFGSSASRGSSFGS
jgi:hypothetical protein